MNNGTEKRTETHACDYISRQEAITAIQKAYADTEGGTDKCAVWKNVGLTNALHIMQDLPSAQPDVPDTNVGDMISRQAALDWLKNEWNGMVTSLFDGIKAMPSAQPERTCVNCGRTVNNGGWYADGRTRCPIEEHYALPKDGYCHLWEKRNITDDDYPERRTDE